jgi:hypothetical protein
MKKKHLTLYSLGMILCLSSLVLLSGCLKGDNSSPQQQNGIVSLLQASPGAPPLNLYFNQDKMTDQPIKYLVRGPLQPAIGNYVFSAVDFNSGDTLVRHADSVKPAYYSMIIYDTPSDMKMMYFADQFDNSSSADASSIAYIRFLQLSPDAEPVNVYFNKEKKYSHRMFADNLIDPSLAKFTSINAGTYSFAALNAQGDTLGSISDITLPGQAVFTLFLRGLASHTQDTLGLKLDIMNNY